uniref:Uncharacterized protein n=1 Tax=Rhizophora mucronata TaxID=61149 RepID=A0A2P2PXV2_RHIMU
MQISIKQNMHRGTCKTVQPNRGNFKYYPCRTLSILVKTQVIFHYQHRHKLNLHAQT